MNPKTPKKMDKTYKAPQMEIARITLRTELCTMSDNGDGTFTGTVTNSVGGDEAAKGRNAWSDDNGLW